MELDELLGVLGQGRGKEVVLDVKGVLGEDRVVQVVLRVVVAVRERGAARTNRVTTWMTAGWILSCADKDECNS